jgi:acetyl esterase/lipase
MKFIPCILSLFLSSALPSVAQSQSPTPIATPPPPPADLEVTSGIETGRGGDTILHAEVIRLKNRTPTRAVIYVHGGGWAGGDYISDAPRAYFLAQAGYLVASIEYRLSTAAKWPAQIEDCKLGVRWLRANAKQYNIDPDHIGIYGHSAGGNLVACMGTMDEPQFEGHGGYDGVSSKVQAVLDAAGPVDFRAGNFSDGSQYVSASQKDKDAGMLLLLFGAPFAKLPDTYKDASPISHVRAGDPPFFIAHGEKDPIVSTDQATTFAATLEKVGVPVQLLIVKNGNHGLGPLPQGLPPDPDTKGFRALAVAFFNKYLN